MNAPELAALIWLGIFIAWALSQAAVRREVSGVLAPLAHPALAVPLLALVAYVAALVYIGSLVGLWESHLITDTIVCFVVVDVRSAQAVAEVIGVSGTRGRRIARSAATDGP